MAIDKSAKVLLLGKTGAGKSSFINYFLGKEVAKTGAGRPVTQNYCVEYEYKDGTYPIKLYDNRGFEVKTAAEQKGTIIEFVKKHNNGDDVFNWFHSIFYCVSMQDARFLQFEADFIRDLRNSIAQNIHIIITKCDCASSEQIERMKQTIRQMISANDIEIYEVASVSIKKRDGRVIEPYGKEQLSTSVFRLLWKDIATRVAEVYARELHSKLESVVHSFFEDIRMHMGQTCTLPNFISSLMGDDRIEKASDYWEQGFEIKMEMVIKETNNKFEKILHPIAELYTSYVGICLESFSESTKIDFSQWFIEAIDIFDYFDDDISKYFPCSSHLTEDSVNLWQALKAMGEIITMKSRFINMVDDLERISISRIPSEEQIRFDVRENLLKFLNNFCI